VQLPRQDFGLLGSIDMKKQLKIGVIGAGRIGKLHAFNLATLSVGL